MSDAAALRPVAVDAMGGDDAPHVIVQGAVAAVPAGLSTRGAAARGCASIGQAWRAAAPTSRPATMKKSSYHEAVGDDKGCATGRR